MRRASDRGSASRCPYSPDRRPDGQRRRFRSCPLRSARGVVSETWGVEDDPAVYVLRLAVAQTHRVSRLGQRLLVWVGQRAAERGAASVRLDCATDNPGLRRFYEEQGFRHVRDVTVSALDGGRQLASSLYERELVR